VTF
jgi:hypothetical protein